MSRDRLRIADLRVECIVGILPGERVREQTLLVDVELELPLDEAARSGDLERSCDYSRAARQVAELLVHRRYRLIETAAQELCAALLLLYPVLESVGLRLRKPQALPGRLGVFEASGGCVEVAITRDRTSLALEIHEGGASQVYRGASFELERTQLDAGERRVVEAGSLAWLQRGAVEVEGDGAGWADAPGARTVAQREAWVAQDPAVLVLATPRDPS